MKLNVGCGRNILPGWVNVDSVALPGVDHVVDLEGCAARAYDAPTPMPFEDNSVDEFLLSHVIEHVRNVLPMMQELYRIAKPDAIMTIRCPHGASDDADEDPTHVRRMFPGSFGYFSQPYYWRADYGYRGDWEMSKLTLNLNDGYKSMLEHPNYVPPIAMMRNVVCEMVATLRAVKPIRPPSRELQQYVAPNFI